MEHKKTAGSFVDNVGKAMRVAGSAPGEYPKKLTQTELSDAAGMARSTLALHKELGADANPMLEQICRIAHGLKVPPAFLLMRPEDWARLAQAIDYYAQLRSSNRLPPLFSKVAGAAGIEPEAQAQLAIQLARALGIDGRVDPSILHGATSDVRDDLTAAANATKRSIFATSSLPPIGDMTPSERLAAFTISVIFGAHHRSDEPQPSTPTERSTE